MTLKLLVIMVLLIYAGFLLYAAFGFMRKDYFIRNKAKTATTNVCIIICARNEEATIEKCLNSILEQNFDRALPEVIVVNDASRDQTLEKAEKILKASGLRYQIFNNDQQEGKKRSITKAIVSTTAELIITRDADTFTVSKDWLSTIVSFYEEKKPELIIAPLELMQERGFLANLQRFESAALSLLTAGYALNTKPFLCNGANLAFTRTIFQKVNGYQNHIDVASGDDVLFLEDVKKVTSKGIHYLKQKDASVLTYPVKGLKNLVFQKIRWSQKVNSNPNFLNLFMGLITLLVHAFSLYFIFRCILVFHIPVLGLIFISGRLFIDFLLLFLGSGYFNKPVKWLWFLPLEFVYSIYFVLISLLSLFLKPRWK